MIKIIAKIGYNKNKHNLFNVNNIIIKYDSDIYAVCNGTRYMYIISTFRNKILVFNHLNLSIV